MKILVKSSPQMKKLFEKYFDISETVGEGYDVALIIRDSSIQPIVIEEVVDGTKGQVPVVVMTGPDDDIGQTYVEIAQRVGIPDDYILRGTEWRVSDVERHMKNILNHPVYPSPKIFADEMKQTDERDNVFPQPFEVTTEPEKTIERPQNTIVIMGLNGGVGASTIATSLMAYYKEQNKHVRLIDTSPTGDLSYHLMLENTQGSHHTPYGEVVMTYGDADQIEQELQKASDVTVVDLSIHHPSAHGILNRADHILFVVTPSQLDYLKLKDMEEKLDDRTIICLNKVDSGKPLQFSYVSLFEKDFGHRSIVAIHESDEVVQSVAEGVPSYGRMKEAFDPLFSQLKGAVLSGQ